MRVIKSKEWHKFYRFLYIWHLQLTTIPIPKAPLRMIVSESVSD